MWLQNFEHPVFCYFLYKFFTMTFPVENPSPGTHARTFFGLESVSQDPRWTSLWRYENYVMMIMWMMIMWMMIIMMITYHYESLIIKLMMTQFTKNFAPTFTFLRISDKVIYLRLFHNARTFSGCWVSSTT